jgi:endogenous inhibitor of DNA gyrase (YacG/DUF329 family)
VPPRGTAAVGPPQPPTTDSYNLEMAEQLFLKCPVCENEFKSEFEVDRASIEVFEGNSIPCPKCEAPVLLSSETMIFKP